MVFTVQYNYITEQEFDTISGSLITDIQDIGTSVSGALQNELDGLSDLDHTHINSEREKLIALTTTISGVDENDYSVRWNTTLYKDDDTFTHNTVSGTGNITILKDGWYQINYHINMQNLLVGPLNPRLYAEINGGRIYRTRTAGYSPGSDFPNFSFDRTFLYKFLENDTFRLVVPHIAGWDDDNYLYRRTFVVDNTKVGGTSNLINFPVHIFTGALTAARSDGNDIKFFDSNGTELDYEVKGWDSFLKWGWFWIRVPTLYHDTDTTIYMYYGNAGETVSQANPTGVWNSNYVGVYHFDTGVTDSTSNGNNGTDTGTATTTGQVNNARNFNSAGDNINMGSAGTLDNLSPLTIEAWIRPNTQGQSTTTGRIVAKHSNFGGQTGLHFQLGSTNRLEFTRSRATTPMTLYSTNNTISMAGVFQHVAAVFNIGTARGELYYNGAELTYTTQTTGAGALSSDATYDMVVGNSSNGSNTFDGYIDEVRISNTDRSAGWLETSFNNQNSQETFAVMTVIQETQAEVSPTDAPIIGYESYLNIKLIDEDV